LDIAWNDRNSLLFPGRYSDDNIEALSKQHLPQIIKNIGYCDAITQPDLDLEGQTITKAWKEYL
jgi:hypothetical protein